MTDGQVAVQHSYVPASYPENARTLKSFVFSRRTASFVPTKTAPKQGALLVTVSHAGTSGALDVLSIDETGTAVSLGNLPLPAQKTVRHRWLSGKCILSDSMQDIVDVSCSENGWISVLSVSHYLLLS